MIFHRQYLLISEARLQSDCFLWAHNQFPQLRGLLFMVNNEIPRIKGESLNAFAARVSRLRAMGLIPGVADMILLSPLTCFEFKLPGETQRSDQIAWQASVQAVNIPYYIIKSFKQWQTLIQQLVGSAQQPG